METDRTFINPPVVETVLGVQFKRLPGLTNAHLGAFWEQNKDEWPSVDDAPPLKEQFESFASPPSWRNAVHFELSQLPSMRIRMKNASGNRMVQMQNCRLDYNWIGQPGKEYPRYDAIRPEFDKMLDKFKKVISGYALGCLIPNQWEITYVNHIPKGTIWNKPQEWGRILNHISELNTAPEGIRFESFGGNWKFEIEPQRGHLYTVVQHAYVGDSPKKEALVIKLMARGPIDEKKEMNSAIDEGLSLGHKVIVDAFCNFTSQQAQDYWNRENSDDDS